MAKVSVASVAKAQPVPPPPGFTGPATVLAVVAGEKAHLHLHLHDLSAGQHLTIAPTHHAVVLYIWHGAATAQSDSGDTPLPAASSALIERGATLTVTATQPAQVLTFTSASPGNPESAGPESTAKVHLLPRDRVPQSADLGGASNVGGGIHADASLPTCPVWLHENHFPPTPADTIDTGNGVHCHSEDEVIFITAGAMRLGNRPAGPGTALCIAADTMYSFLPGPEGLSFINFRAARPSDIRFASGATMDEVAYWADRLPKPDYITG